MIASIIIFDRIADTAFLGGGSVLSSETISYIKNVHGTISLYYLFVTKIRQALNVGKKT